MKNKKLHNQLIDDFTQLRELMGDKVEVEQVGDFLTTITLKNKDPKIRLTLNNIKQRAFNQKLVGEIWINTGSTGYKELKKLLKTAIEVTKLT